MTGDGGLARDVSVNVVANLGAFVLLSLAGLLIAKWTGVDVRAWVKRMPGSMIGAALLVAVALVAQPLGLLPSSGQLVVFAERPVPIWALAAIGVISAVSLWILNRTWRGRVASERRDWLREKEEALSLAMHSARTSCQKELDLLTEENAALRRAKTSSSTFQVPERPKPWVPSGKGIEVLNHLVAASGKTVFGMLMRRQLGIPAVDFDLLIFELNKNGYVTQSGIPGNQLTEAIHLTTKGMTYLLETRPREK